MRPVLLRHDNVTPPARTPWGGRRIRQHYKAGLDLAAAGAVIGESWEISVEPSFPSRRAGDDKPLADIIAVAPGDWLGEAVARRWNGSCPVLVKLLDAADNLSVQVHPSTGDPALSADESGKPESWVVLEAQPGAGIYLGFRDGVGRDEVAGCLAQAGPLDNLMQFVPVNPGDTFIIEAGTPHAIGAGLTLVEPQLVEPGKRGITYRYWDWNRRYDADGKRAASGQPRALHVERSLAVTRWLAPRGETFVRSCRGTPTQLNDGSLVRERLVDWEWFAVERWQGSGALEVAAANALWALCCVGGKVHITTEDGELSLRSGQSGVVPACAGGFAVHADDALLIATRPRA